MAASPVWKVYGRGPIGQQEYLASFKYPEDAGAFVAIAGYGATIRYGHKSIVWTEGSEGQSAAESYDHVAEVVEGRVEEKRKRRS